MPILHVALNLPLKHLFDYLPPDDEPIKRLIPGQRLRVPFGKKSTRIGLIISLSDTPQVAKNRLKKALALLDGYPLLNEEQLELIKWASSYYHHPIGDTAFMSIPSLLRQGKPAKIQQQNYWQLTDIGKHIDPDTELKRAKKQLAIFNCIQQHPNGVSQQTIRHTFTNDKTISKTLNALQKKNLIALSTIALTSLPETTLSEKNTVTSIPKLSSEQQDAIDNITKSLNTYRTFLLNGITGSGKTEIYLQVMQHVLQTGKQALILIPEINLTTQIIKMISSRFKQDIAVLHSELPEQTKLSEWLRVRDGSASIILGTRSAIWTPIPNLGIIIIDEEHDPSYKQQNGLHYSARDMALIRGKKNNVPVILGSATPSMESIKNARDGRYHQLRLSHRIMNTKLPKIHIHDISNTKMHGAISDYLLKHIEQRLANSEQTLLFLNRRGYSPIIMCHHCSFIFHCLHCDNYMTLHKQKHRLICHHCGHKYELPKICPHCAMPNLSEIGHGTERLEETLATHLPNAKILRIDRDTTRRKNSMRKMIETIQTGDADILIGTQMLAKGHHFPNVSLVGIIDADQALFSIDYRASERMAQLFIQVSGRAGRAKIPGTVIVQTHYPNHCLLKELAKHDYQQFTDLLLTERQQAQLPPFSFQALLRTESEQQKIANTFLNNAKTALQAIAQDKLDIYGPLPAPMRKRANRYRFQLLIQANSRRALQSNLILWLPKIDKLPEVQKIRWSIDIDPQNMS